MLEFNNDLEEKQSWAVAMMIITNNCLAKQYDGKPLSYVYANSGCYSSEEVIFQ